MKKTILIAIFIILLAGIAKADLQDIWDNRSLYYQLDANCTDWDGNQALPSGCDAFINSYNVNVGNGSYSTEGAEGTVQYGDTSSPYEVADWESIEFIINRQAGSDNEFFFYMSGCANSRVYSGTGTTLSWKWMYGTAYDYTISQGTDYHVVLTNNGTHSLGYVNGALINTGAISNCHGSATAISWFDGGSGTSAWSGDFDNIILSKHKYTQQDVTDAYNSSNYVDYADVYGNAASPPTASNETSLNITGYTPNTTIFNQKEEININISWETNSTSYCYLYMNETYTGLWKYWLGSGTWAETYSDVNLVEGNNTYYIMCQNDYDTDYTANISILYHDNITINNFTGTYTSLRPGKNITFFCNYTPIHQMFQENITIYINNTYDNTLTTSNNAVYNYTINQTDVFDNLTAWCYVNTTYKNTTSSEIEYTGIDRLITFRGINYLGETLSSIILRFVEIDLNVTNNPTTMLLSSLINSTHRTINYTINGTDTSGYSLPYYQIHEINTSTTEENISFSPNKLVIQFQQNGSVFTTEGWISDEEKSINFSNSSLIVVQQNLTEGYVHVRFGQTNGENHTQFYEYINDYETHITEEIEILQKADWSAYLKVMDLTGSPIKDAVIRIEASVPSLSYPDWSYHELIGQRLSDDSGNTFIWADKETELLITVTKTGYLPWQQLRTIGDDAFTEDSPLEIYMDISSGAGDDSTWVYFKRDFSNRSLDISGTIMSTDADKVEITTTYRETQGLSPYDITSTENTLHQYAVTLKSGTDYALISNDDITVKIYIDGALWGTINIDYDGNEKIYLFTGIPDETTAAVLNPILYGMIILLSFASGVLFSGEKAPATTFKVLCVLLSLVSVEFLWVATIALMGPALNGIKGLITE